DYRARRGRPARDPAGGPGAAADARLRGAVHHARPVASGRARAPGRDHVRGGDRRARPRWAATARVAASLHGGADRVVPPTHRPPRSPAGWTASPALPPISPTLRRAAGSIPVARTAVRPTVTSTPSRSGFDRS